MGKSLDTYKVSVIPDLKGMKGIGKEIDADVREGSKSFDDLDKKGSNVCKNLGIAFAAVGAAITAALGKAVMDGINGWKDLEQNLGGAEAVYGEYSDAVVAASRTSAREMGLTASEFLATSNKMGALLQGSGMDQKQAMELSVAAMQRASDVASVMGVDTTMAMDSIAGAAKGNLTMMDNLGVAMTATSLDAYALVNGYDKTYSKMTQAEKEGLIFAAFLDKTSQYAGNYAKENDTLAGSIGTLGASYQDLVAGMAGGQQELVDSALSAIIDLLPSLISNIVGIISGMVPQIVAIIPRLASELLPEVASLITTLIASLVTMLPEFMETGIQLVISLLDGLVESLPTLIPAMIDGITKMLDAIVTNFPLLIDAGMNLVSALVGGLSEAAPTLIPAIVDGLLQMLDALLNNIPLLVDAGIKLVIGLTWGLIKAIPHILQAIPQIFVSLLRAIGESIDSFINAGGDIVKGIARGIAGAGSFVLQAIKDLAFSAIDSFKSFLGIHSPSKVFEELGGFTGEGFGIGLEKSLADVNGMIRAEVSDIESSFTVPKLSTSVTSSFTAPAGGNTFNVYIDGQLVGSSPGIRDSLMALLRDINREKNMGMLPV